MKANKLLIALILISIIGTLFLYNSLPGRIPTHYNFKGEIDGYGDRSVTLFLSILPLLIYTLMIVLPKIDPKRQSYEKHQKAYNVFQIIMVLFLIGIHWMSMGAALGYNINVSMVVKLGIGLLLIITGNYMGQIRHNYFFGIKTPWTLANEVVWRKTHRVGGILFVIAGLIMAISGFFNASIVGSISFGGIFIAVIVPYIYSYLEYKKIKK